jgi:PTS system mannose/fructose/sorbose family IID component
MAEKIQLSQADRKKVWWRSQFLQGAWNYERMQNLGWAYSLIPAIKNFILTKRTKPQLLNVTWNSSTLTLT